MSGITQDRIDRVLSSLRTTHSPLSEADRQEAASVIVHLWSDYRRESERRQRLESEIHDLRLSLKVNPVV